MGLLDKVIHLGPLDGYKKIIGGSLLLASQAVALSNPASPLITPLLYLGNWLLGQGLISDGFHFVDKKQNSNKLP